MIYTLRKISTNSCCYSITQPYFLWPNNQPIYISTKKDGLRKIIQNEIFMAIIVLGSFLILLCTSTHAAATHFLMHAIQPYLISNRKINKLRKTFWLSNVVLLMFFISIIDATFWAVTYVLLGVIETFEQAMYFSLVTYTTLGYGDITIHEKWQLLASFEAAIGIIIFGWSTAIVMAFVQKLYLSKN